MAREHYSICSNRRKIIEISDIIGQNIKKGGSIWKRRGRGRLFLHPILKYQQNIGEIILVGMTRTSQFLGCASQHFCCYRREEEEDVHPNFFF